MERLLRTLGRIAIVAAGVTGAVLIVSNDGSTPSIVLGVLLLLVAGYLANRAWIAGLPFAAVVVLIVFNAIAYGTEDYGDLGWWGYAYLFAAVAGAVSLLVLLGVGVRRIVRAGRRQRSSFSPQNDAW